MIDVTFRDINRLFILSFKAGDDDPTRRSFDKYYITLIEIKHFNASIDNKPFFSSARKKTKNKHLKNLSKCQEMSRNLLDLSSKFINSLA